MLQRFTVFVGTLLLTPVFVYAQQQGFNQLTDIIDIIDDVVDALLPIAVTAAVLFFFWGLATFIFAAGDPTARERGRSIMIWGVLALFLIVAIWGILQFIANLVGVDTGGELEVPDVADEAGGGASGGFGSGGGGGFQNIGGDGDELPPAPPPADLPSI